jgi:hypothetical protein
MRLSVAIGGGPAVLRVERLDVPTENRVGPLFDATLSIEPGGFLLDLGARMGATDVASALDTSVYVRLGYSYR